MKLNKLLLNNIKNKLVLIAIFEPTEFARVMTFFEKEKIKLKDINELQNTDEMLGGIVCEIDVAIKAEMVSDIIKWNKKIKEQLQALINE